jgi:hypothetical protein
VAQNPVGEGWCSLYIPLPAKRFWNAFPACVLLEKKLPERHFSALRHKNTPFITNHSTRVVTSYAVLPGRLRQTPAGPQNKVLRTIRTGPRFSCRFRNPVCYNFTTELRTQQTEDVRNAGQSEAQHTPCMLADAVK